MFQINKSQIVHDDSNQPIYRIVIDGDPGAGKTTFIKRLCYTWSQGVLQKETDDKGLKYLKKYGLVIPVILRLLTVERHMFDVVYSQFEFLSIAEICAVMTCIETDPAHVLLLQDGFDEYSGGSVISKILSKELYPSVVCLTTSRSHAIEQLRRDTSQAVEHHVRLCGFNEDQVKQYIKQFCEYHKEPAETGEALIRVLFDKRPDILDVAKIPIRTEMVCIVWMVYEKLGKTLADLYEMFIRHLIVHWSNKQGLTDAKDNISEENKHLLLEVGKMCNRWEKYNRLQIVFSTVELKEILKEGFQKVIRIGLIVKSHPSHTLEASKWSFPHLTIQEYLIAYHLGNVSENANVSENENISSFATKCKNYKILRRCEMIFTFLCSKYPEVANKILTELILKEKDETGCKELIDFIYKIIPHFDTSLIDIPLPSYLHLKYDNSDKVKILFESAKRHTEQNLKHLTIEESAEFDKFLEVPTIEDLKVTVNDQEQEEKISMKLKNLTKLTSININSEIRLSTGEADILKGINTDRLKVVSVTAPGALQAVADSIQRLTALEKLHIDDTSKNTNKEHERKILSSLKNNNKISVSLCVPDLDDRIIKENLNIKVNLKVQPGTLRKDSLSKAVRGLDFAGGLKAVRNSAVTGGLYKLDLSHNNLRYEGDLLGTLMAKLATLRVLCVDRCSIEADTVQAMIQAVRILEVKCGLQTLSMGEYKYINNNDLSSGGKYLGELISLTPDLNTLDVCLCKLTPSDLADMSDKLQQTSKLQTKIQTLDLWYNNLGEGSHKNRERGYLIHHMPHLRAIRGGGEDYDDPIPAICEAVDAGSLINLHFLDMTDSKLQPHSLHLLGKHLPNMTKLEAITLRETYNVKPEDYHHVYENVPDSLTHLNIWTKNVRLDPYLLLDYKHQLKHLLGLNINIPDTDLDLIQELLEQQNPDINVYNARDEDIWKMYVRDKSQD